MLEITNLTKQFQNKTILNQCQLSIADGSIFGLIGPNGSGKTTLLKAMAGIYECEGGNVYIDEQIVFDNTEAKKKIFYLSDEPFYFFQASLKVMREFYEAFYPNFDRKIFDKYKRIFQLNEDQYIKTFSKGMKRQAFLCIALAIKPNYLLLDEVFDGLDPLMRLVIKKAMSELVVDSNCTIIISSHNLRELEDICDTFGILDLGKVQTSGVIDEVKTQMHKYQLAYDSTKSEADFGHIKYSYINVASKVVSIVVKGDGREISKQLNEMKPVMMEEIPLNLEELFIYEMREKGYGDNE